jgi:hypothetical protein
MADPPFAALMGDPSGWRGHQRNSVWRNFLGPPNRVRQIPEARRALEAALVGDLRATAARYPADQRLRRLVADLRANSDRFAGLWDSGAVGRHEASRKTVDHPQAGPVTLDCDVLTVKGSDLHIMIYTAEPGTEDAERLALLTVLGTQAPAPHSFRSPMYQTSSCAARGSARAGRERPTSPRRATSTGQPAR